MTRNRPFCSRPRTFVLAAVLSAACLVTGSPVTLSPSIAAAAEGDAAPLVDQASRKMREEDFVGALRLLEQAVAADPRSPLANVMYQDTTRKLLGVAEIQAKYKQLAADNPDDALFAYFAARLLDAKDAEAAFGRQANKFKTSPWPHVGRARALQILERPSEAVGEMDAAVVAAGADPLFRAFQAYTLEAAEKHAAAAEAWRQVIAAKSDDPTAHIGLGEALRRNGSGAEAIAAFEAAAKLNAKDADPIYRVGLVHLDARRYGEARTYFDKALGMDRSMVEALCAATEAVLRNAVDEAVAKRAAADDNKLKEALDYAARAEASNPDSARAHFVLGSVYEVMGEADALQLDTALAEHQKALDLLPFPGPARVRSLVAKAYVLLRLARWDDAEDAATQALDIDENNVVAMLHAGHALCQVGKFEDAIKKYYKPGLKVAKDDPRLLFASGMASWSDKKHNDAKKNLEKAADLEPRNGLYRMALGEYYYELKRYKDAVKELAVATEERPNDWQAWLSYGRACTSSENWEDAAEAFEKVCELSEDALDEFLYLAIIYADHLKDRKTAKERLEKFKEYGGTDENLASWIEDLLSEE